MFVTNRVEASLHVDRASLLREGTAESVAHQLRRAVIAEADKSAWKARPESVHVRCAGPSGHSRMLYVGIWSPRSARFVGGEYDGDTLDVQLNDETGMPPEMLTLPYRERWSGAEPSDTSPGLSTYPAYERSGIEPIDDVWIYTHIS